MIHIQFGRMIGTFDMIAFWRGFVNMKKHLFRKNRKNIFEARFTEGKIFAQGGQKQPFL